MRVPLSWLRDFNDCRLSPEEIAKRLTLAGLEVESIERIGIFSRQVRAAGIVSSKTHPRSEDLRVVELRLGKGRKATAVTAAPNIRAGMRGEKVAVALPGAVLIDPKAETFGLYTVEARPILGVESNAVLCSEKELGLSEDHSGVVIVEDHAKPGRLLIEYRKPGSEDRADVVLEVAILPNYGRCLSIIGMARELAALTRTSFELALDAEYLPSDDDAFDIRIDDPDLCSRYSGYVLEGVTVKPSPYWIQRRLVLSGHKPISNLVDVTNYVMTEMGQPMHAFDLDRLPVRNIAVRRARPGETIYTLDQMVEDEAAGQPRATTAPRQLDESTLLITSGDKAVAVAGVIGGLESQIYPDTKNILLESANFDAVAIRKAMSSLKVTTESSYRFSREVDPALTTLAINRATYLLKEIADVQPSGAISDRYPRPAERRQIEVDPRYIHRSLGLRLDIEEIHSSLRRLGFHTEDDRKRRKILVEIPGFRQDVTIPADIAEEVIRVVGFDRVEPRRLSEPLPSQRRSTDWDIKQAMREFLVGAGLQDVISYSLTVPEAEERLRVSADGEEEGPPYLKVLNPASQERSALRRTLLGGLLETVVRNRRQRERIALCEIGPVWYPESGAGPLPGEIERLGIVLSGPLVEPTWAETTSREADFFDMKGIVEGLLASLHVEDFSFQRTTEGPYHPGIAAELNIGGRRAGALGQLHPAVVEAYELQRRKVIAAEFDLQSWIDAARSRYKFENFSKFPPVREDLNLVVGEEVAAADVMKAIRDAAGPLLAGIRLLNLFRGEQLGAGKKSLSFRLEFCADDRSLLQEEVNEMRDAMLPVLEETIGATLRA